MRIKQSMIKAALVLGCCTAAVAAVSPEEAKKLGGPELTETGAIKAGNADGSIPPYSGKMPPSAKAPASAGRFTWGDPYANEKPLYVIDGKNMDKYADKLSEGQKALLKRYPTYRIEVFPTHRDVFFPKSVMDATVKCATTTQLVGDGVAFTGGSACIPFPLPKNGYEVMWNAVTQVAAPYERFLAKIWLVDSSGSINLNSDINMIHEHEYWDPNIKNPRYMLRLLNEQIGPPAKAGSKDMRWVPMRMDQEDPRAWQYIPGQRRVRLAPEFTYDTVATQAGGLIVFDEIGTFDGKMDRFDFSKFTLKEMIVPFHTQKTQFHPAPKLAMKNHPDPSAIRWELRRVLVVEAPLKTGQRHVYKKKVFYIDQDSWKFVLYDSFDQAGSIHRTSLTLPYVRHELPAVTSQSVVQWDLTKDLWGFVVHFNDGGIFVVDKFPASTMIPDSLAGSGLR